MFWNRPITNQNVIAYASNYYYNPKLGWSEFNEDFGRIKRLNSLFAKFYIDSNFSTLRTIINTIIILGNCFEKDSLGRLAFFFVGKESHSNLYTILKYIKRLPEITYETSFDKLHISQKTAQMLAKL